MALWNKIDYPIEKIRQWIAEGKTQTWIAGELQKSVDSRITPKSIYKVCKKHGIKCQRTGPRSGAGHYHSWKGGRTVGKGYIYIYCPGHPNARHGSRGKIGKYVLEHRLVMEKYLGRYLECHEVVHHKNKNPADNRIENLVLYPSNGKRLEKELKGKVPNWSEEGKRRLDKSRRRPRNKVDKGAKTHQQLELDGV